MKNTIYSAVVIWIAAAVIATAAYAGGGMGGGMGGGVGGGDSGMMGGHMLNYDSDMNNPRHDQPQDRYPAYQNRQSENRELREEIRARRHELSDLYRSEAPDRQLINQKIEELSRLEKELDQKLSGRY